jgi:hypothetical protein
MFVITLTQINLLLTPLGRGVNHTSSLRKCNFKTIEFKKHRVVIFLSS